MSGRSLVTCTNVPPPSSLLSTCRHETSILNMELFSNQPSHLHYNAIMSTGDIEINKTRPPPPHTLLSIGLNLEILFNKFYILCSSSSNWSIIVYQFSCFTCTLHLKIFKHEFNHTWKWIERANLLINIWSGSIMGAWDRQWPVIGHLSPYTQFNGIMPTNRYGFSKKRLEDIIDSM